MGTTLILLTCQSQSEQEWIAYIVGSQARIENADGTLVKEVETGAAEADLQWSPDGSRMSLTVVNGDKASLWIANADGSEPRQVSDKFDFIWGTWLTDDLLITNAVTQGESLAERVNANYILDLQDGSMQLYSQEPESVVPLSSGNQWLADNAFKVGLQLYDLEGKTWTLFPDFEPDYNQFDVSPSGQEIVLYNSSLGNDKPGGLYKALLDENNVTEPELLYSIEGGTYVRWSPNGQYVGLLDRLDNMHLLDGETFSLVRMIDVSPLLESRFTWSPDSKFFAVSKRYDEPEDQWEGLAKINIETGEIIRLTETSYEQISDWRILSLE
jgi:dipeptidyl aminopeptidase/acylaminoacyl peptidase